MKQLSDAAITEALGLYVANRWSGPELARHLGCSASMAGFILSGQRKTHIPRPAGFLYPWPDAHSRSPKGEGHGRAKNTEAEVLGALQDVVSGTITTVRKRRSKSGQELKQTLLVFRSPAPLCPPANRGYETPPQGQARVAGAPPRNAPVSRSTVEVRWAAFKAELPHQRPPFSKRNWGSPLHSLCSYQGKLKPSLAHHLVEMFSTPGDVVVDPFSGAGTVPFEACRTGRIGFGIDISGLGFVLTRAKVSRPDEARVREVMRGLQASLSTDEPTQDELASAAAVSFNSAIPDYFHPDTLREVLLARRYFLKHGSTSNEWAFVFSCCLHILHGNRPYALSRRSHPITPFAPTGPTEYRALIPRLSEKIARASAEWEPTFTPGGADKADCALAWRLPSKAAAVVTSPPFFDSTRFYMTNWMRYWFTGWERSDFDKGVGDFFETRQRRSLDIYGDFFRQAYEATLPGAWVVMHLGMSKKCDMAAELVVRVGDKFEVVDTFYEGVEHCESHGVSDKGTVNGHSYLVLRRRD